MCKICRIHFSQLGSLPDVSITFSIQFVVLTDNGYSFALFCVESHLLCHAFSYLKGGLEWTVPVLCCPFYHPAKYALQLISCFLVS